MHLTRSRFLPRYPCRFVFCSVCALPKMVKAYTKVICFSTRFCLACSCHICIAFNVKGFVCSVPLHLLSRASSALRQCFWAAAIVGSFKRLASRQARSVSASFCVGPQAGGRRIYWRQPCCEDCRGSASTPTRS